ncbi:hypothetical protein PRZ48_007287 [Zasmidium cellare]|uniref:FAD/NAD(P)-binding domain-containing protein n=1 Tax=Zasmidium cellare TaxID=395010 RepID=A0ABR0EK15_ZASCE|nr:hypothetical protein PRZ48_007287 [Zasmidium cellare]
MSVLTPQSSDHDLKTTIEAALNGKRKNGELHPNTTESEVPHIDMHDALAFTPRRIRIITVGAGFSGLMMAHKFQHRFPELQEFVDHTIFESRADVGGTWLVNTYPGCQCDVPSHIYAFPFDPNPEWSQFYSSSSEIHDYIKRTTRKWNLDRDIQLNSKVVGARWQPDLGKWRVSVEANGHVRDEYAEILISGQGVLQIAVIGNGSSGIQIVPQLAKLPGTTVMNFARGPAWIYYRVPPSQHLGRTDGDNNPAYTEEQKTRFRDDPEHLRETRRAMIRRTNRAFQMFIKDSAANREAMATAEAQMRERLGHDERLCDMLIPKWSLGCRRITPGEGYLEAFGLPNCDLTVSPITHISESAVHTQDGKVHEIDVLVCATGFDVTHRPQYPTVGLEGVDLRQAWEDDPKSYLSVAVPRMPNYFITLGPNALAGHGSLLEAINWNGDYFVKWIKKFATEDIRSFVPNTKAVDELVTYGDEIHKSLVWTADCTSWYKRGRKDGRVTALFAGSGMLYKRLLSELRMEDFNIEYNSTNRFKCLGNGFTALEMDPDSDLAWYIEH